MKYSKRNNWKANYITLSMENFWNILKICENLLKYPLIYSNNKKTSHNASRWTNLFPPTSEIKRGTLSSLFIEYENLFLTVLVTNMLLRVGSCLLRVVPLTIVLFNNFQYSFEILLFVRKYLTNSRFVVDDGFHR